MKLKTRLSAVLIACAVAAGAVCLGSVYGQRSERQAGGIVNKTEALEVVSVLDAGEMGRGVGVFKVTVRNIADRAVVEYTFFRKDGSALTTSGATIGWALAPGETDAVTLSLGEGEELTLAAALLEDGTGQGDAGEVSRLKDYREGVERQYRLASPILRQAMSAPEVSRASAVVADLQVQLSGLPVPPVEGDISPGIAAGMTDAKQFIRSQAGAAKEGDAADLKTVKARVAGALEKLEKALARFEQGRAGLRREGAVR